MRAEISSICAFEEQCLQEDIDILMTEYLIGLANSNFVPTPTDNDHWQNCEHVYPNRKVLTAKGISVLQSLLRQERHDKSILLIQIGSVVIGIIGALTALFAIILE
ncbi:MAG: hypothetical protein HQ528_10150 [Candidatus Marinimicrobia bacterium]|nr:hypothetical protein [Candidatus Neomarinimicrobiota bacterium]